VIGTILDGRYKLERVIGAGGMGAVYEATHTVTGKRVAVKLIQQVALGDTDVWSRFQREARASSAIDTRHIVAVTDSGRDAATGLPFMAMELLRGEDLGSLLDRRGKLDTSVGVRLIAQACLGISKAHRVHVVHRDIKPANLFLTEDDESDEVIVKLLDFGIAKVRPATPIESDGLHLTQTGKLLGTPLYMSPEQAQGAKDIDARTDVWSIGAVLYETLTGQSPFQDADNLGKLILAICSKRPARPKELAEVPDDLDDIVMRCLTIERDERYSTIDDLLTDLSPWLVDGCRVGRSEIWHGASAPPLRPSLRGMVGSQPRSSPGPSALSSEETLSVDEPSLRSFPHLPEDASIESTHYATSQTHAPKRPRSRGRVVAAAAAALGVTGVAAALWLGQRTESPAPPQVTSAAAGSSAPTNEAAPTVPVVIDPADATVLVDGKAAVVSLGKIELAGEMGEERVVTVVKGELSRKTIVVITKEGARPDRVSLDAPVAPPPTGAPSAAASSVAVVTAIPAGQPPRTSPAKSSQAPPPATAIPYAPNFE
jgi:serine/threonine-protein kinase